MAEGLEEFRRSLQELIFEKKIRTFKVISPIMLLDDKDCEDNEDWARKKKKLWGEDPVHLSIEGYDELLNSLLAAAIDMDYNRACSATTYMPAARGRVKAVPTWMTRRQNWVDEDDATAHRVYNIPKHNQWQHRRGSTRGWTRGRPGRPGRGRAGPRGGRGKRSWPY
jgi:hypothetical protein